MELLKTAFVRGKPSVLQVEGEIDISTAERLRASIAEALSADPGAVVDMAGVTFFDAAGVRVILEAAAARNGAGPLTLVGARRVEKVLELVGLNGLSTIVLRERAGRGR